MDAAEYLREKKRMCQTAGCKLCPLFKGYCAEQDLQTGDPEKAVELVRRWSEDNPAEGGITLTAMERRFAHIYIEKGYLWAARDKEGELKLYKKSPDRCGEVFTNTSPTANGCRKVVMVGAFPGITWNNSPICLPKLIKSK